MGIKEPHAMRFAAAGVRRRLSESLTIRVRSDVCACATTIELIATLQTATLHLQRPLWSKQFDKPDDRVGPSGVSHPNFDPFYVDGLQKTLCDQPLGTSVSQSSSVKSRSRQTALGLVKTFCNSLFPPFRRRRYRNTWNYLRNVCLNCPKVTVTNA